MYSLNAFPQNPLFNDIYHGTTVVRKPISGIVSGYHQLPYVLVSPDESSEAKSIEVNGKINVSPRFVISAQALGETFGQVFDPETFDRDIQGRLFSFAGNRAQNLKIESEYFRIEHVEEEPRVHLDRVHERLMMQENLKTALIFAPHFNYYPISLDKFIAEMAEREFRV